MATHDDRCLKCYGAKHLPAYARHNGGICYRCEGTGREPPKGESRGRPVGRGRGGKVPHPSAAEAKAIADRELAKAAKLLEKANDILATAEEAYTLHPDDRHEVQDAMYARDEERAAATYELAGLCIGRCVVDFQRFLRAIERGRRNVHGGPTMAASFEAGLKAGIQEQAARYEGIDWEGR